MLPTTLTGATLAFLGMLSFALRNVRATEFVSVQLGPTQWLRGKVTTLSTGQPMNIFRGVRYAQPPTGSYRFAEPRPSSGWNGSQDALEDKPRCLQTWLPDPLKPESEDCLFLNVFSPNVTGTVPVMLFIHGGAYYRGSEDIFDASLLASQGVVVVLIEYRLGLFGFLSNSDHVIPGNYGMLDQVLAMKWVQKYIHVFGGDPEMVTIFGQSAGSAGVSLHVLSPLSKGLFKRAIMESGVSLSPFAIYRAKTKLQSSNYTSLLGQELGCRTDSSKVLLGCLREANAIHMMEASSRIRWHTHSDILATPTVETTYGFLPDLPYNLLKSGQFNKVDTLRGYNSGEWSFVIFDPVDEGISRDAFPKNFARMFKTYGSTQDFETIVLKSIENAYLGQHTDKKVIRSQLVDALAHFAFALPGVLESRSMTKYAPNHKHYFYEYDYRVSELVSIISVLPKWMKIVHTGELKTLFLEDGHIFASETDKAVAKQMQTMWANFAIFGNPTEKNVPQHLQWVPYTEQNNAMMKISENSKMTTFSRPENVPMYEKLLKIAAGITPDLFVEQPLFEILNICFVIILQFLPCPYLAKGFCNYKAPDEFIFTQQNNYKSLVELGRCCICRKISIVSPSTKMGISSCLTFLLVVLCGVAHCRLRRQTSTPDYVTVELSAGQSLRGEKITKDGQGLNVFKGIRYGAAPVGSLRLAAPQEAPSWTGSQDALDLPPICWQRKQTDPHHAQSEDCLFLNVYSPDINGSLSVMVWIHGGSYNRGAGIRQDPSQLARHGVVVVTLNYRLGPFGFMSSGDDTIPGNFGLLDQNLAMKWVQKHITAFGGDPASVTIFGQSAGAASVSLHLVSPLSKGLFKRAIMESGSSLASFAVERPATKFQQSNYTSEMGVRLGCNDTDSPSLLTCFRNVPVSQILDEDHNMREETGTDILVTPTVETAFGFLPDYPSNLQKAGKINAVDTLSGYTNGELSYLISDPDEDGVTRSEFLPTFRKTNQTYAFNKESVPVVDRFIESYYLENATNPIAIRSRLVNSLSEGTFGLPAALEIQRMQNAEGSDTKRHYFYEYEYRISVLLSFISLAPAWMGIAHAQDLEIVFFNDKIMATNSDRAVANTVQTMWANFAMYGNPTEKNVKQDGVDLNWTPYTKANNAMLKIAAKSEMTTFPGSDRVSIYAKLLENFIGNSDAASLTV
ncbi:uncharacterized protein LOC101857518 [Aplysia californica]|uniref:Uncharacterized protein LOC101857518 n=1 Tax=Aplysia californica TaxID=6500 RepID=A0ABM1W1E8_APLCA|nr:uncharacterized protein LOC101857518 [Aplysia californica]